MQPRIELAKDFKFFQPLLAVNAVIEASGLDHKLLHLVEMRASQINGCAYCIDMHSKDARAEGETEQRLYSLDAWREALSIATASARRWSGRKLSRSWRRRACRTKRTKVSAQFSEAEIKTLTLAITMINVWNRFNVAFRTISGDYKPGMFRTVKAAS